MRTPHKTLTRLLQADLIPIAHVSFNEMYTGYSRRYDTVVFVKVFSPNHERKFRTGLTSDSATHRPGLSQFSISKSRVGVGVARLATNSCTDNFDSSARLPNGSGSLQISPRNSTSNNRRPDAGSGFRWDGRPG